MKKITFTVEYEHDDISSFAKAYYSSNGKQLTPEDHLKLGGAIKRGANVIRRENYADSYPRFLSDFKLDWVFPKSRKELRGVKYCVYFLTMPTIYPSLIKIGYTQRLIPRLTSLQTEMAAKANVIAYVNTYHKDDSVCVERVLHAHFETHRKARREWFDSVPVMELINSFNPERTNG